MQTRPRILRVTENVDKALEVVASLDADLVVLPELFNTGYALTAEELARVSEVVPHGPTVHRILDLCRETGKGIVAGFAERAGAFFFNSAVFAAPSELRVYRKVHLFDEEKAIFQPGNGFEVIEFKGARIGIMICFDWFFPESCRTLMLKGADIIAHPASLVLPFWPRAAVTRAVENHLFIVTADRVGRERQLRFIGNSLIVSPTGECLASAGRRKVEHAVVDVDPGEARAKGVTPCNDIVGDRRPEAYDLG